MLELDRSDMETLPHVWVVEPFGKINYWCQSDGSKYIQAYLLRENIREGSQTGIAIDGSSSMRNAFGYVGLLGALFRYQNGVNAVSLTAKRMCSYLARKVDADDRTTVIYWGTGSGEDGVESVGDLTAYEAEQCEFAGPTAFGSRNSLLPSVRYFVNRFSDAPWGIYLFITNGRFRDLDAVVQYTKELARAVEEERQNELKLVLIGVGRKIDVAQMRMLDDLKTGTSIDLWDYKLAADMRGLVDIFAEVVDENTVVAPEGELRASSGAVLDDFGDQGVPAVLRFTLPANSKSFSLEIGGQTYTQPIF